MRPLLMALPLLLLQLAPAQAQVAVNIGIHLPVYPRLQRVPDYPVYYAPEAPGNFFFYDGLYWVFEDDFWYYSSWYNGPWYAIEPEFVPVYLLRVPVRYYRRPPVYFSYWRADAPPRWNDHWGPGWAQRRSGWDRWDRRQAPPPAPLPDYQRKFPQSRYPQAAQQDRIRDDNYRYQPRNPVVGLQPGGPPPMAPGPNRREREERIAPPAPRGQRMDPPAPLIERSMPPPPMRRPELDRPSPPPERRAPPEPRVQPQPQQPQFQRPPQMQPQMQPQIPAPMQPRARPEPQMRPPEQPRMDPGNRRPEREREPGPQRRWDDGERGRGGERGNERGGR